METKLGQLIIKTGLITPEQLDETLKNQVIFGGRLGTNLIEMGYLEEQDIANLLSRKLGVPCVTIEELSDIPPEIIAVLTPEIVKKHQVIPLNMDRKRMTVAIVDPSDFSAIDELSFLTGCIIIPMVAPELMIINAMERYYGIKRETRYLSVPEEVRAKARKPKIKQTENESFKPAAAPFDRSEDTIDLPMLPDSLGFDECGDQAGDEDAANNHLEGLLSALCRNLASAASRDIIATELLDFLGKLHPHASLFLVKGASAAGWMSISDGTRSDNYSKLKFEIENVPSMAQAIKSKNFFMGHCSNDLEKKIYSTVGIPGGSNILNLPIMLANRVVAVISVGDSLENLSTGLPVLQKIALKTGMAFEIQILKNKILVT